VRRAVAGKRLAVVITATFAIALALNSATPVAVTSARFHDSETMNDNLFSAFGAGPAGLSLEPGESTATWLSEAHAPVAPVAKPLHGSLELDFGEITFGSGTTSPDAFRIRNRSVEERTFEVIISPSMEDLFHDPAIRGGGRLAPGDDASVQMSINGGARPPGCYSGTLVVRDLTDEFYRIVRVTIRILGTHETGVLNDAVEDELVTPAEASPDASVTPTDASVPEPVQAPVEAESALEPVPAPEPEPPAQPDARDLGRASDPPPVDAASPSGG